MTDAASGLTVYYFTPEQGSKAVCAGESACNSTWPPVMASSAPSALTGFSGQFTLVQISGGGELAYDGWPLHTYAGDSKPGDTNGQGSGGKWFAVTPALTASGAGSSSGGGTPAPSGTTSGY
jgi:predicted lipoprotein with Yx(FWY)xxD motif